MVRWLQDQVAGFGLRRHADLAEEAAAPRRRPAWVARVAAGLGAMFLLGLPLVAMAAPEAALSNAQPAQLSDDDGGHALFDLSAMAPGERASRCLVVAYEGAATTPVAMRASGGGNLDNFLDMAVEVGSGGASSDCSGFSGSEVYHGSLAGFVGRYGSDTDGLATWDASSGTPSKTFKFTFTLPDDADTMGKTATADFSWQVDVPVPEPEPEAPAKAAEPEPETPEGLVAQDAPFEIGASESTTPEKAIVIRPKAIAAGQHKGKAVKAVPASALGELSEVVGKLLGSVAAAAPPVLKRGVFPATLVAVVIGFIGLQNRIDRNDPKLAMAPLNAEPDLTFDQ
jgi:hypothetical protein